MSHHRLQPSPPRPKPVSQPIQSQPHLSRHPRRLLETLAADGASARDSSVRPGHLTVCAPKGRITAVLASLPATAAAPLIAGGFAEWQQNTLRITTDGRSFLRRLQATGDDSFQSQHRTVTTEVKDPGSPPVVVDAGESPVAWLARRRDREGRPFLEAASVEAGERFRRDLTVAQMLPSITSNWSAHGTAARGDPSRTLLPSEVAVAARQRVGRAMDALGSEFAGLVMDACGFVKRLELIESERGWPARSAKVVLRIALAHLARHYGLSSAAVGAPARDVRHWGAADFRPTITPDGSGAG